MKLAYAGDKIEDENDDAQPPTEIQSKKKARKS